MTDSQVGQLWDEFEKILNNTINIEKIDPPKPSKNENIKEIKRLIEERGYCQYRHPGVGMIGIRKSGK